MDLLLCGIGFQFRLFREVTRMRTQREIFWSGLTEARSLIRRISVASSTIQTIDDEIKLSHYLFRLD